MASIREVAVVIILCIYCSNAQDETGRGTSGQNMFPSFGSAKFCIKNSLSGTNALAPKVLETVPGRGFDNLRNLDMAEVFDYSYFACKETADGKYLLPDNIIVTPQHETDIKYFSEIIYDWYNYESLTSSTINIGGPSAYLGLIRIFSISGSYSKENVRVKKQQILKNAVTTRVQIRRPLYNIHLSSGARLHPEFRKRVYEIAANFEASQNNLANYYAELLIREYGTHYLSSINVGGVLAKNDYVDRNFVNSSDTKNISASSSWNFALLDLFNFTFRFGYQNMRTNIESMYDIYTQNRLSSDVIAIGGPPLTRDISLSGWINGIDSNLAIIDREGEPLSFAITPTNFPEISEQVIRDVANMVQKASDMYYKDNTVSGCTDTTSPGFNLQANYPVKSACNNMPSYLEVAFGGIYQTCSPTGPNRQICKKLEAMNPLTGYYSCPPGYTDVTLLSSSYSESAIYSSTETECLFFFFCSDKTVYHSRISVARYEVHWCAALYIPSEDMGNLFGGFYSSLTNNPFTATRSCPSYYLPQPLGKDVEVCTSTDYELGAARAVKFGGFFSCSVGNPLVDGPTRNGTDPSLWTRTCPLGYNQHLVIIENGCEINICLETGSFTTTVALIPPSLPPYRIPRFNVSGTEPIAIEGSRNTVLLKNKNGEWTSYNYSDPIVISTFEALRANRNQADSNANSTNSTINEDNSNNAPPSFIYGIAIAALVIGIILTIVIIILAGVTARKSKRNH